MHTSLGSQCQHKEWAECEIIRDNPPLNWASIGRWQPLSRELGGKHSSPVAESVSRSARWSWAIAGEWDDKSWQWRNNNNTADHHNHHLILQIWAYDSHQAIIIIIASLSSSSWQHRTISSHHVYHLFIILLNSSKQLIGMIFLRQAHLLPDNHCPTSSIIIIIMTALHPDPGSHDGPASRTPASWSLVRHPRPVAAAERRTITHATAAAVTPRWLPPTLATPCQKIRLGQCQ